MGDGSHMGDGGGGWEMRVGSMGAPMGRRWRRTQDRRGRIIACRGLPSAAQTRGKGCSEIGEPESVG